MKTITIWFVIVFVVAQITALEIHQNHALSSTSPGSTTASIFNGTASKDFRIQCDSGSLGLVRSPTRANIYYLRGVCGGLYSDPHGSRCSFLDLSMCYINDAGNIRPQKLGHFTDSCSGCTFYSSHGSNMLACTCGRGDGGGGGIQEAAIELDNLLYVKNGFLSCYGYTNFECPGENVPY
ncbi:hypothetical protein F4818DRAFT_308938 [Hypoxylon cercidicola]|nr:hypothetical protein F4818DRAFT_308938 [Hypoxylon cercidicola]